MDMDSSVTEVCSFPCQFCGTTFSSSIQLTQHWQEQHQAHQSRPESPVYQVLQTAICATSSRKLSEDRAIPEPTTHQQPHPQAQTRSVSQGMSSDIVHDRDAMIQSARMGEEKLTQTRALNSKECVSGRKFCCEVCGKTYTTSSNLYKHSRTHNGAKYSCSYCAKSFRYQETLKRHERTHSEMSGDENTNSAPSVFPCSYCKQVFTSRLRLGIHLRSHPLEKPFKCDQCEKTFSHKSGYLRHKPIHSGERSHLCTECGQGFLKAESLRGHLMVHSAKKLFSCGKCNKKFTLKRTLQEHELLHRDSKHYKCRYCDKRFRQRSTLWGHEKVHTRKKLHRCNLCDDSFGTSQDLKRHKKSHWMEMRRTKQEARKGTRKGHKGNGSLFQCDDCGEAFAQRSVLKTHKRRHTGEKPFECPQCGKRFRHLASHRRHVLAHSGLKPFECEICGKAFTKKSYLEWHTRKFHESKDATIKPKVNKSRMSQSGSACTKKEWNRSGNVDSCNDDSSASVSNDNLALQQQYQKEGTVSFALDDIDDIVEMTEVQHDNLLEQLPAEETASNVEVDASEINLADQMVVSFQDVCGVPVNEECVQTINLLDHVMELAQISQRDLEDGPLSDDEGTNGQVDQADTSCEQTEASCIQDEQQQTNLESKEESVKANGHTTKHLICELCGRTYASKSSLVRHMNSHTNPKPYKCDQCDKSYSRRPQLTEHFQFEHGGPDKAHKCGYCEQAFPNATRLALHVRVHTGSKPFVCATCQKAFTDSSNLHRHERTHSGVKSHECPTCGLMFLEKAALQRHILRHEEKKFPCEHCEKSFSLKIDLTNHSSIHKSAKQPECPHCGMIFQRELSFKKHLSCSAIKPKRCLICGEAFTSMCLRRQHEVKEHKFLITDSGYTCGVCHAGFIQRGKAVIHLRKHFGITTKKRSEQPVVDMQIN